MAILYYAVFTLQRSSLCNYNYAYRNYGAFFLTGTVQDAHSPMDTSTDLYIPPPVVSDSWHCSTDGIAEPSSVGNVVRPPTKQTAPMFLETSQDAFHFDKIHIGSSSLEVMNYTALRGNPLL